MLGKTRVDYDVAKTTISFVRALSRFFVFVFVFVCFFFFF